MEKMKRWYCRNCGRFKRFAKTRDYGFTYEKVCRCCGTPLIDAKMLIETEKEMFVRRWSIEHQGVNQ